MICGRTVVSEFSWAGKMYSESSVSKTFWLMYLREKGCGFLDTGLMMAAANGHVEVIEALLKAGTPYSCRNEFSLTFKS